MFEELLKQWANEQGFQTWSQDHAAVLRNLVSWLNGHAVEHRLHTDVATVCPKCNYMANYPVCVRCGTSIPRPAGKA